VRHTNLLVIADRGFPFLAHDRDSGYFVGEWIPTILQVYSAIRLNFQIQEIIMAQEFLEVNPPDVVKVFTDATASHQVTFESHTQLKSRVPYAVGLIRTGDTTQYANMILVSG